MTGNTAQERRIGDASQGGRMRPIDYAVFGLFLGIVLTHALAIAIIVASNGIVEFLYAFAGNFGWTWFTDRSVYAEWLALADGALEAALMAGVFVAWWSTMPRWAAWKSLPSRWTRGHEFAIPAPVPVRILTAIGWIVLFFMAIYALLTVPQRMVDGSREAVVFVLNLIGAEPSASTIDRLQDLEKGSVIWILICVYLSHSWAQDQCRRIVGPPP